MLSKTKKTQEIGTQQHISDLIITQLTKSECYQEQTLTDMIKAVKEKYKNFNGNQSFLYILARGIDDKSRKLNIFLQGQYVHYISFGLQIGNIIRLVGQAENLVLIDSNQNQQVILIVEPQFLVSPTTLASFDYCARKALLLDNFKPFQQGSSACMFQGNIIHQLFQTLAEVNHNQIYSQLEQMKQHHNDPKYQLPDQYVSILQDIYKDNIKDAFYLKLTLQQTITNTIKQGIETLEWVQQYFKEQKPLQIKLDYYQKNFNKKIIIKQLKRIEQDLHSPLLGFLGKPDLVIEIEVSSPNGTMETFYAPLELKTGKTNDNHIKQVIVYAKMMSDKQKVQVPYGFLLYLQTQAPPFIKLIEIDKAQIQFSELIFSRNKYVIQQKKSHESTDYMNLPKIDDMNYQACNNCEMQNICAAVCKVYDIQEPDTEQYQWFLDKAPKLQETSIKYLNNMLSLIRQEEATQFKDKDLDQTVFKIANKRYGDFIIQISKSGLSEQESQDLADKFMPQDKLQLCSRQTEQQIRVTVLFVQIKGQKQLQIDDNDVSEYSLSQGNNYEVFKVNVRLKTDFMVFDNVFKYDWTIRQYQQQSNYKSAKTAITQLVMDNQYSRKKDILVLGHSPRFLEYLEDDMDKLLITEIIQHKIKGINEDQQAALIKCVKAEDFAIILGYPGTGKSTLIAHLLYVLFFLKQKVLVCGYTNNSVNLIIDKFIHYYSNFEENCLRFTKDKTVTYNSQFNNDKINFAYNNFNDSIEIQEFLSQKKIYFTTCLSQTDQIVSQEFDYCIVDEASQVTEPQTIQNIMCSKKFILVGDYQQLTPIVKSSKAKVMLQVSLLERLAKQFPQAVSHLTYQYRMNEQIMKLANFLVYDGKLKLPNNEIARAKIEFNIPQTNSEALKTLLGSGCIQFIDCATEEHEQNAVIQILKWMNKYKVNDFHKVVITTYNKQARKLEQQLKGQSILTIDKSQGLDCDCIILVCSQNQKAQNHLLSNIRRINVALTRAKKKLIIVGNYQYLQNITNMSKLLNLLKKQGCIVTLDNEFLEIKD